MQVKLLFIFKLINIQPKNAGNDNTDTSTLIKVHKLLVNRTDKKMLNIFINTSDYKIEHIVSVINLLKSGNASKCLGATYWQRLATVVKTH